LPIRSRVAGACAPRQPTSRWGSPRRLACRCVAHQCRLDQRSTERYGAVAESGSQDINVSGNGLSADERPVVINLTPEQVIQVIQASALRREPRSSLMPVRRALAGGSERPNRASYYQKGLSTSVIQGLIVLVAFADGKRHTTSEVAAALGIPKNTVYRYIRTLAAAGLLEQDATSRLYRLTTPPRDRTSRSSDTVAA
jgi:biotin operon repressor